MDDSIDWQNYKLAIKKLTNTNKLNFIKNHPIIIANSPRLSNQNLIKITSISKIDKYNQQLRKKFLIQRQLDLHGLTQLQAKIKLNNFIMECYYQSISKVLVITGKGIRSDNHGILRQKLISWLNSIELINLISSYSTAKQKHGGDGAFYIKIKDKNK